MHSIPFAFRVAAEEEEEENNANSECLSGLLRSALLENNSFLDFMLALTVFEFEWLPHSQVSTLKA